MTQGNASWSPTSNLDIFNRKLVELEKLYLAFLQKEVPLHDLRNSQVLKQVFDLIDLDPWQAFLFTRIKSSHAMTPRHGINVMLVCRVWCSLHHRLGDRLDDFCFAALVHDAGHWFSGDLVYVFGRYRFDQAEALRDHCLNLDWGTETLSAEMKDWILNHHENHDGSGYPNRRTNPPLLAQILHLVDCFEGLTTKRHFRPALSQAEAMQRLNKWTPYKFHPGLMKSWNQFLGTYPPGTAMIRTSSEISVVIPGGDGANDFSELILTNKLGDEGEESVVPLDLANIKSETVPYFQPPLPEAWKPLRPDTMELPRNYEEPNGEESPPDSPHET